MRLLDFPIRTPSYEEFPETLTQLEKLPNSVRLRGTLPPKTHTFLTVIGSRDHSQYGKSVVESLLGGLRGYNIAIVSGLALGIDGCAHTIACEFGLPTLAIPGSGLNPDVLYPRTHYQLAVDILESGGAICSPFADYQPATSWTFPVRNQFMAGIAHGVLIIEARENSGTLITANAAAEMGRSVMAVPGHIHSQYSLGSNNLIREGATLVQSSADILEGLGYTQNQETKIDRSETLFKSLTREEQLIMQILTEPAGRTELIEKTAMGYVALSILLSQLEIKGLIREECGVFYRK